MGVKRGRFVALATCDTCGLERSGSAWNADFLFRLLRDGWRLSGDDARCPDCVYFVDEALRQLSIVEQRPEADILRDLLAGQDQEAEAPQPVDVKPRSVSIDLYEMKDGDGKRHFVCPKTYIAFCGVNTEPMQYLSRGDYCLPSLVNTRWSEYDCPVCRERLREIARDMMRRLGYPPEAGTD